MATSYAHQGNKKAHLTMFPLIGHADLRYEILSAKMGTSPLARRKIYSCDECISAVHIFRYAARCEDVGCFQLRWDGGNQKRATLMLSWEIAFKI